MPFSRYILFRQIILYLYKKQKRPRPQKTYNFLYTCMDIYIEYVIIDNLVINGLLLWAVSLTAKIPATWWRILLSAALGVVFSLFSPLINLHPAALWAVKLTVAPAMTFSAFWRVRPVQLLWSTLLFIAYTFVLGGSIIALIYLGLNLTLEKAAVYYYENIPLGAVLGGLALTYFLVKSLADYINFQKKIRPLLKKIRLTLCSKEVELLGFFDSGNNLVHEGLPVCFVSGRHAKKLLKNEIAENILAGGIISKGGYLTVAGVSSFRGVEKEIEVGGQKTVVVMALSKLETKNYDVILSSALGENENETHRTD